KDKASFHGENKPLEIACQNLPKFDLAYCLSVHKSQGSEYDHVFLIAPKGCESFGREIFYTAATRAKKNFSLFASFETIKEAMSKSSQRISSLCLRN
ncbi:MAG TPA: ATP-dependent RecD-like DNA helicase, partial [Chlamydiales bacterium]|nr:ATP-dependent RecD-like DNA helicase [Chlamydiales bacterium]